jgi:dipeptidyl aminopeptidase/acylaminoacyl peptidase
MRTSHIALLALALVGPTRAQGLTPQQLMQLRQVMAVSVSDDARHVAFLRTREARIDEGVTTLRSESFVQPIDGGDAVRLPAGSAPVWRPRHPEISYLAHRDGDDGSQVYVCSIDGSEERRITSIDGGVRTFAWRPDGEALAFTAVDPAPELRGENRQRGFRHQVVDEDYDSISLWLWDLEPARAKRLTNSGTVQSFVWSPTGTHLAAAISPRNLVDDSYMFTRLFRVDAATSVVEPLANNSGKLKSGSWSPDGRRFAYIGAADRNDPHAGTVFVVESGSAPVAVSEDLPCEALALEWRDADVLDVLVDVGVRSFLVRTAARAGAMVLSGARALPFAPTAFARVGSADSFVFVASTARHPTELMLLDEGDRVRRLTDSNPLLGTVVLGAQRQKTVIARDGLPIEGVLILPSERVSAGPAPLVIVAHGGPEAHYQDGWLTRYSEPGQVLAARGYVVWYPNYRSSTGYGVAFAKSDHGDPMGREFTDHLDAIDTFVAEGLVDRARVGLIGGSYGGYTAAWAATHATEHFAAAVSFVPFVDLRTKWLTSDIPNEFYFVHYQERWPHEQAGFLADRSPLTYAARCRTPLLLCGGDADPRVHPSQPFMLYRAIKTATSTPCRYVKYPGEGHGNARNVHRYDFLLRSLQWLDHYLVEDGRSKSMPPLDLVYPEY